MHDRSPGPNATLDASAIADRLPSARGARVLITGAPGIGKSGLAERLAQTIRGVLVEPPDVAELDAIGHAAVQFATRIQAKLPDSAAPVAIVDAALRRAEDEGRWMVWRLPASWSGLPNAMGDGEDRPLRRRAWNLMKQLMAPSASNLVVVAEARPRSVPDLWQHHDLALADASASVLDDDAAWDTYAGAARELRRHLKKNVSTSPAWAWRLSVAAVALGAPPHDVAHRLAKPTVRALTNALNHAAKESGHTALLQRLARLRQPLETTHALQALGMPASHAPLITMCLGQVENGLLRPVSALRRHLPAPEAGSEADARVCFDLAEAHRVYDGVDDLRRAEPARVVHALERAHHLACGGARTEAAWTSLRWLPADLRRERARSLSLQGRYREAADLYAEIVQIDDKDDYAHHYRAYNLDRAGLDRDAVVAGYAKAVELDRWNGWWNARHITFLIERARFRDAEHAQRVAMHGLSTKARSTLAFHVATAWLRAGEVARARALFNEIGEDDGQQQDAKRRLEAELVQAEDVARFGDTARPAHLDAATRWSAPVALPAVFEGSRLGAWYGGRVVAVDADKITLVLAPPPGDTLYHKEMTLPEWVAWSHEAPEDLVGAFIEVGEYGSRVAAVRVPDGPTRAHDTADELRYLRAWAS